MRITHLPTGIVVTSSEKSQHQNRARAMKVLKARLYEQQRDALDTERSEARKSQIGSGDRSERIRTYNFPQGRVTDHRINLTLYNLPKVIEGEALDDVIDPLIAEDQAARLASLEESFGLEAAAGAAAASSRLQRERGAGDPSAPRTWMAGQPGLSRTATVRASASDQPRTRAMRRRKFAT